MAYDVTLRMFAERRRVGLGPGQASLITALTSAIVEEFLRCQCPVREPEALRLLLFHALPRASDREPAGTQGQHQLKKCARIVGGLLAHIFREDYSREFRARIFPVSLSAQTSPEKIIARVLRANFPEELFAQAFRNTSRGASARIFRN